MSEQDRTADSGAHLTSAERADLDALFIALADEMECEPSDVMPADLYMVVEQIVDSRIRAARDKERGRTDEYRERMLNTRMERDKLAELLAKAEGRS
jgi:hypothetical protein